jgi:hypothetical protein
MPFVRTRFLISRTTSRAYFPFIALIGVLFVKSLAASERIQVGYRDFPYPEDTASNSRPTGDKPESKLWFNDGVWWGVLWSTPGNAHHIHRLDRTTQDWLDTGTAVDNRSKSRVDVLWDEAKQYLYVAAHVYTGTGVPAAAKDRGKLYRFSYNAPTDSYTPDFNPVEITLGKSESLVLAKDTTGRLCQLDDPTSTKQNLNSATGLVVLASDEETFYYFHNDLALNPR